MFSAVYRSLLLALVASTSMMWHSGQIAETMSMSSDSSTSQPVVAGAWRAAGGPRRSG